MSSKARCLLCQPPQVVGAGILDHLRLFHPDEYGDGPACWPDGELVIYDTTSDDASSVSEDGPVTEKRAAPRKPHPPGKARE